MPQRTSDDADLIAKLAKLDQALARGIADADAGRVHSADEVFRQLRERIQQRLNRKNGGSASADPPF